MNDNDFIYVRVSPPSGRLADRDTGRTTIS